MELPFGSGPLLLDAGKGFAGGVHLVLQLITLADETLHFVQAGFGGSNGGGDLRLPAFEILRGPLGGAHLLFPARTLRLQFLQVVAVRRRVLLPWRAKSLGPLRQFAVEILQVLAFLRERLALFADLFLFEGERLLAFEKLDPVAAHDFHLLRELVLPGRHLFELHFKFMCAHSGSNPAESSRRRSRFALEIPSAKRDHCWGGESRRSC